MDLSSFRPAEIVNALVTGAGVAVTAFFVAPKHVSDLGLNRLLRRKHLSEIIDALTGSNKGKDGHEEVHPLAVQVKFQAAFGGIRAYIPKGSEILALLENRELAVYSNMAEYAECTKFVAYSESMKAFIPRGNRTDAELNAKRRWNFIFYLFTATPAIGLFFIPPFNFKAISFRILLSYLLGLIALVNAVQAKKIGRAQKLLEKTRALEPSSPLTTGKSEAAQEALNGTTHPARPSGIAPEKASGTLPERGASVKDPDPSKH